MSMKRCPECGEKYSETYKDCPFCEEAEAMEKDRPLHRRPAAKRSSSRKDPSALTPILIVVILLLSLTLGYLFFGDAILEKLTGGASSSPDASQSQSISSSGAVSSQPDIPDVSTPDVTDPDTGTGTGTGAGTGTGTDTGTGTGTGTGADIADIAALPGTLTLSKTDFTIPVGDPVVKLTVLDGGSGYTWISEDEGIASVDEKGVVTPISVGMVKIYVTNGTGQGSCIVRVKAGTGVTVKPEGGVTVKPEGGTSVQPQPPSNVALSRDDFTLAVGEAFQLTVSNATGSVSWASSNPSVVTVSDKGVVTGVTSGKVDITATVGGKTLTAIARVK